MRRFLRPIAKRSQYSAFAGVFLVFLTLLGLWIIGANQGTPLTVPAVNAQSPSPSGVQPIPLTGFWWTDSFGWISLNCQNDWNGSGVIALPDENRCAQGNYAVVLDFNTENRSGELHGRAWSPNLGFICGGRDCEGPPPGN